MRWRQRIPGSKSLTNRALVLAALADGPSQIHGALRSRDTQLMTQALRELGARIVDEDSETGSESPTIVVEPATLHGGTVACGLAGTVMRFLPPVAALTPEGHAVVFDGDAQARRRPMREILDALRALGIRVEGGGLPFTVHGGSAEGGEVTIDASASSQFVSGLLLAGARFRQGITVTHRGGELPSRPHIQMTLTMLQAAGVSVEHRPGTDSWRVLPGAIAGRQWHIEPDLSNATPFLSAAAVTGGTVTIVDWPQPTDQAGDRFRGILEQMGCTVRLGGTDHVDTTGPTALEVTGPAGGNLRGVELNMADIGELTPTVVALAALATGESRISGVAHLRGHETDRLAALSAELRRLGGDCTETADGLVIRPAPLHGGVWHSYADHRMATAGAILGLRIDGLEIADVQSTSKTLPGFQRMWQAMVSEGARG